MFRRMNIHDMTQTEYDAVYALMTAEKRARVDRFRFDRDKRLTVCAELLARQMLAVHDGVSPESIVFSVGEHGKPYDPTRELLNIEDYDHEHTRGGLGRFITFQIADEYAYAHEDGKNVLTLIKRLAQEDASS